MILSDGVAAISTVAILVLHLTGNLAIWHLYLAASITGGFGQIQQLAYSTSITLLVTPLKCDSCQQHEFRCPLWLEYYCPGDRDRELR